MKQAKVEKMKQLNMPKEVLIETFNRLLNKGKVYGVFDAVSEEFINLSTEEKDQIITDVAASGSVELRALAKPFFITSEQMKLVLDLLLAEGVLSGAYTHDNSNFITQEQLKFELIECLKDYDTIRLDDLAENVGLSSKEIENVLNVLIDSKELEGVIDLEREVFSKEILEPISPATKDEELVVGSMKDRKVALDEMLTNLDNQYHVGRIALEEYMKHFKECRTELASIERQLASIEGTARKEIRCPLCGGIISVDITYCPDCKAKILHCTVCLLPIVQGDEFVKCPYCKAFAHKDHLLEWIKVKGSCPYCKEHLTESDIPS